MSLTQSAGLLVADTKLDLAIAPAEFLSRATHLWDSQGSFGQVQNQAYGYLWPMGPFFLLGDALGLPGWVVQRLWVALIMCTAMVGVGCLTRALGVHSDLASITAGFAYALSPRMLTVLGPISIEAWPSAVAPWVLLPLVLGSRSGSPRRAAAVAGLAVAMVGGVNAAATFVVIPLGVVWLLTREPGPRRRQMMIWWPVATLLGTVWWLVPLLLMGSYSPPFLDYIESAPITTFPTTIFDALRGTSNWIPYIDSSSRSGNDLITQSYLVLNSAFLLVAGLVGLALPRNRQRTFLWAALGVGLFMVSMGHLGAVQGWFAQPLHTLLDGTLAPLRNVHKFDAVIRLPMVIGLAWVIDELSDRAPLAHIGEKLMLTAVNRRILAGTLVMAVAGASVPVALGRLTPADGFGDVPLYWTEAATYLEQSQDSGVALLVPGSSFGTYVWGTPRDEPLQILAGAPWAVRNAVPLSPAGNIRMLDEIERRLSQGDGSVGFTHFLRRAGVSHLVVRNDLVRASDIPDPLLVHQTLDSSPGLSRVATFGPEVGGDAQIEGEIGKAIINGGWQSRFPAVEVYEVADPSGFSVVAPSQPTTVIGGPEDLLDLADLRVIGDDPVLLASDAGSVKPDGPVVLTDGLRSVERSFGRIHDATSAVLEPGTARRSFGRLPDYELQGSERWMTRAELVGVEGVSASISQSDVDAGGPIEPAAMPASALDGSPQTAWQSGRTLESAWWRVDLQAPRELKEVDITVGERSAEVLRVSTGDWFSGAVRIDAGETGAVVVPGRVSHLEVQDISARPYHQTVLAEVDLGFRVRRKLVVPPVPSEWGVPDVVVLRRLADARTGCALVDGDVRCSPEKASDEEETSGFSREVALPVPVSLTARLGVSPVPGPDLDRLILQDQPVGITTSSAGVRDVRAGALAAIDGNVATTWVAAPGEVRPELHLNWLGRRRITGIALDVARETAARRPESLTLTWPGGSRTVQLSSGRARFPAISTTELTVEVLEAEAATDLSFNGTATPVPVGITELRLEGLPYLPLLLPDTLRTGECGEGPVVRVNLRTYETRVRVSPRDLANGAPAKAFLCGTQEVVLSGGSNEIEVEASSAFVPDSLILGRAAQDVSSLSPQTSLLDDVTRVTELHDGEALVATRENANPGWAAQRSGEPAVPRVFDGWRQGWLAPGKGPLRAHFAPDRPYVAALGLGALPLLLLLLGALLPHRRDVRHPAVEGRRLHLAVALGALLVTAGLIAGWGGAAAAALGAVMALAAVRRMPTTAGTVLSAPLFVAALAYVARPWGSNQGWAGDWAWPQLCSVLALASVFAAVSLDLSRSPQRAGRRMKGRSTRR